MFRLRDLKNGLYQIHMTSGPAFEGTPRSIFHKAINLGVKEQALVKAVNLINLNNYDYADFYSSGEFKVAARNK